MIEQQPEFLRYPREVGECIRVKSKKTLQKLFTHPAAPSIIRLPGGVRLVRREDLDKFVQVFDEGNRTKKLADEMLGGGRQ